jgi:long-chain acyl-CoA synthetase
MTSTPTRTAATWSGTQNTRTLGDVILSAAERFGDDIAFQVRRGYRTERLTFRQVGERALQIAGWFTAQGLTAGDRIVVWAANMPEYALLYFGAWLARLVVVPIDVRTRQDVIERFVAAAGPKLGFKSRDLQGTFGPLVQRTLLLEDLFDLVADTAPLEAHANIQPDDLCEVAFTSGTTGVPKGVMLTHANFLSELEALNTAFPLERSYRGLSLLPLSHVFEQVADLLTSFTSGVRMTYLPRINEGTIIRALRDERITCFVVVPELLRMLLDGIERRVREEGRWRQWQMAHRVAPRLSFPLRRLVFRGVHQALGGHLEWIACASAPLDLKVAQAWERIGVHVYEAYGLTEVTGGATLNTPTTHRLGSVGRPVPGVDIRIAAEGEIQIRGRTVMPGYFDNPDLTQQVFVDGWFRTGDVGSLDAEGFLHISGREAFKIVLSDGRKVYPEDIERILNPHPLVTDSCVVGIRSDGGERVHAVLLTDAPTQANEIVQAVNRQLDDHQQIMGVTVWTEPDFPRTPILKIDRKLVRVAVEQRMSTAYSLRPSAATLVADPLVSIVARIAGRQPGEIHDELDLGAGLGLDSIARVELLSDIEEELGRIVDELAIGSQTTVGQLRRQVQGSPIAEAVGRGARWPRAWCARLLRPMLHWMIFRVEDLWLQMELVHPERAANLPVPSLLIFNYQGPYVPLFILRALPARVRARVAIATDARLWRGRDRWIGMLGGLAVQAFPFEKSGGAVGASLEELGRWLDDGYAVIVSPEGDPEPDGKVLPFLGGTGLMAVSMQVPVVPFKVQEYWRLFPGLKEIRFPYFPMRRGAFRLVIGEPLTFPKTMPYQEATRIARQALIETR